jgi:N-acyl-D-aspartate/D-glutamate deacylase
MILLQAQPFGFADRYLLRKGLAADIVAFGPTCVIDTVTFEISSRWPQGIEFVWVNGVLTLDSNGPTGKTSGRALKPLIKNLNYPMFNKLF